MIEEGKIDYSSPAEKYLPELAHAKVLVSIENEVPKFRDPETKITIKQLLNHTSGSALFLGHNLLGQYYMLLNEMGTEKAKEYPTMWTVLVEDPGSKFVYGNSTDILGFIVEEVTGKTLDEVMEERICKPVGMNGTKRILSREDYENRAKIHGSKSQGFPIIQLPVSQEEGKRLLLGGSGLHSTLQSYSLLLATILNGGVAPKTGERILKESTLDKYLFTPQLEEGIEFEMLPAANPVFNSSPNLMPGTPKSFSSGLLVNLEDVPGGRKKNSGGWAGLANSYYFVDRTTGIAAIISTQMLPFGESEFLKVLQPFEEAIYKSL